MVTETLTNVRTWVSVDMVSEMQQSHSWDANGHLAGQEAAWL
jgi:hypothetical protein